MVGAFRCSHNGPNDLTGVVENHAQLTFVRWLNWLMRHKAAIQARMP